MFNFRYIVVILSMAVCVLFSACETEETDTSQDVGLDAKVKVTWNDGQNSKEFGPGDYTAQDGAFPNDVIQEIHVPFGMQVLAFQDYNFSGHTDPMIGQDPLGMSVFKMSERGLGGKVSGLRISKSY